MTFRSNLAEARARHTSLGSTLVIVFLVACCLMTAGCDASNPDRTSVADNSEVAAKAVDPQTRAIPFRFFSPTSFWNQPVPADASLDPNSAASIRLLANEARSEAPGERGPSIATVHYSVPIYTVPANQPMVRVSLLEHPTHTALRSAFSAVPLPPHARPAYGSDGHLVVFQPSSDRLWEFWRLGYGSSGWHASWGGAMEKVSSNSGVYGPKAWPGAESIWGGDASSLALAGGLVTLEDLEYGKIDHALAMAVPNVRAGVYASPAKRTDGYASNPLSLPMGAHLRLNPKLDISSLHLPRLTRMLAEAAQRYGIFIRSSARSGGIVTLYGEDPTRLKHDPYVGPPGYFEGLSSVEVLAGFPWNRLQLLKMELHGREQKQA